MIAIDNRSKDIKNTQPNNVISQCPNPFKKIEMSEKYKFLVDKDCRDNIIYCGPSSGKRVIAKEETGARTLLRIAEKNRLAEETTVKRETKRRSSRRRKRQMMERDNK